MDNKLHVVVVGLASSRFLVGLEIEHGPGHGKFLFPAQFTVHKDEKPLRNEDGTVKHDTHGKPMMEDVHVCEMVAYMNWDDHKGDDLIFDIKYETYSLAPSWLISGYKQFLIREGKLNEPKKDAAKEPEQTEAGEAGSEATPVPDCQDELPRPEEPAPGSVE